MEANKQERKEGRERKGGGKEEKEEEREGREGKGRRREEEERSGVIRREGKAIEEVRTIP